MCVCVMMIVRERESSECVNVRLNVRVNVCVNVSVNVSVHLSVCM